MVIYEITVTDTTKADEFEGFMLDDIFPGIPKNVSRLGQVDGLILLRGANTETSNQFIWMVGGVINKVPGDAIGKIEAFGAAVGIADGDGDGVMPGVGCGVISGLTLALVPGVEEGRIPAGMPGAAGRNPSRLASVEPVLFGAGPEAAGVCAGTTRC